MSLLTVYGVLLGMAILVAAVSRGYVRIKRVNMLDKELDWRLKNNAVPPLTMLTQPQEESDDLPSIINAIGAALRKEAG